MALEFLEGEQTKYPDLAGKYAKFAEYYKDKLWHQLTLAIKDFVNDEKCFRDNNLLNLYKEFVSKFEHELNQLTFAQICVQISRQFNADIVSAVTFLETLYEKRGRIGQDGALVIKCELAHLKLLTGDNAGCKSTVEEAKEEVDKSVRTHPATVYSHMYRVFVQYFKKTADAQKYYQHALLYLSYTPLDEIRPGDRLTLSRDLALAALTSPHVYNFGDLLRHPVINVLKGTEYDWLFQVLHTFNNGNLHMWKELWEKHAAEINKQPAIKTQQKFLDQKVRLMALVEMVFRRDASDRAIAFREIARAVMVEEDEVEMVLMKALSLKLLEGSIDQVAQVVTVTYVVPRTLGEDQIQALHNQIKDWQSRIGETRKFVEDSMPELLVS